MNTTLERITQFSPCRKYRYTLWREWDCDSLTGCADDLPSIGGYLMVIGLNPSTADETRDDPTIRRCIGFAKTWGFGALCMTNLFAWRDTKPENMKAAPEPCGMENGRWITEVADGAGMILAAWGKHGSFIGRDRNVMSALKALGKPVHCLKRNNDGSPIHPLYVAANTAPIVYTL